MKVIATNIFDFTTWYKFGIKSVPKAFIIDLDDANLSGEELLRKTGLFEEEYEVFYIEVKEEILSGDKETIDVSLYDAVYIIPISETGSRLLQNKIPDFKLFAPLDDEIYRKLMTARNNLLAMQGAKRVLAAFNVEWKSEYDGLQNSFLQSLSKYRANLNAEQETVLDQVLFYERSKPYPLTDHGFLFDVGSIIRTRFGIQDDDIKNKDLLKDTDPYKYELVEQIISLSRFLTNREIVGVWSEFVRFYDANTQLYALNEELLLSEGLNTVNNLLVIGLYLKFRDMIRNTRSLEEKPFTDYIQKSLTRVPEEAKIALLLNGLFFGGLKFKELHYKFVPLEIARMKFQKPAEPISIPNHSDVKTSIEEHPTEIKRHESKDGSENVQQEISNQEEKSSKSKAGFDHELWCRLEPSLKKYHKNQQKKIKEKFDFIMNYQGKMFNDKDEFFINALRSEITNRRVKSEQSKINEDIVIEVEEQLKKLLPIEEIISS
jgi:hypothetical protein